MESALLIAENFEIERDTVVYHGDCIELLRQIPDGTIQLVVTSAVPPLKQPKG